MKFYVKDGLKLPNCYFNPITKMSYFRLRILAILVSKLYYGLKYRKEFAFYV